MGKDEPSFIEPNRCNCSALRKASRRMSQFYDSALVPSGLRSAHCSNRRLEVKRFQTIRQCRARGPTLAHKFGDTISRSRWAAS